ncbi:MAG: S-layer homology domain-containing protein [Clostridia bacterium]|nr:S-layer homology domain-containing protein [Clostridia bacterium]
MVNGTKRSLILILILVFGLNIIAPVAALDLERYGYFPDVKNDHWAKQVITKMNLRNVVSGYPENGTLLFKPDQSVTQGEAVLMALRTMGLQNKESLVDKSRYLPFSVPDWAKASALVAVDEGLIVGSQFVWEQEASRAWVAQLLVRMLGQEDEIYNVTEEVLPFTDSYSIPIEYLNYVKVANKYGLIKGNDQNQFQPNKSVTRAEMVAFLSRAEQYLDISAANLVIGEITAINNSNISLRGDNGIEYTLFCDIIKTNLYDTNGEIWVSDLQVGDRAYVIVDGTTIQYLELNPPQSQKIITSGNVGTILQVYPEEKTIVVKTEEGIKTYTLAADAQIVLEKDGTFISIDKLVKDQEVRVALSSNGQVSKVTVLSGNSGSVGSSGVVFDINKNLQLITIKNVSGLAAYQFADDTAVIINNRFATLGDIKIGDSVQLEVERGVVTKITLLASEVDLSASGTVKLISIDSRILTYQTPEGELKAHYVENDASIDFGGQSGTFGDIKVGDTIEVKIEQGKIKEVSVKNRKLHELSKGFIVSTDYTNRIITVRNSDGQLSAYEVASNADIRVNNNSAYLHDVKKDMQVQLELTDGKITYLVARDTLQGTVLRVSNSTKVIELALETGENRSYTVDHGVYVLMEGISGPDLDDINKGDTVEVKVVNNRVTEIRVQRTITYKITETYSGSNRIKVVDDDNNSRNLYIYSDVELIINGINKPKVSDLKVGDIVKATFLGYTLQKVELAPVVIGSVAIVNSTNNSVTINTYDGRSFTFQFGSGSKVIKNKQTYYNIGTLVSGDRVAVEESLDGGKVYTVMNKVSGKIGAMYKDKTTLYLQITQTNWQKYEMLPSAYLHQGTVKLEPSDFKLNDNVDIYLANGKVYEVEKK